MEDALWKNVRTHQKLSDYSRLVWQLLAQRCRETGSFTTSIRKIATYFARPIGTTHRAIALLQEYEFLSVETSGSRRLSTFTVRSTHGTHSDKPCVPPMERGAFHPWNAPKPAPYMSAGAGARGNTGVTPKQTPGVINCHATGKKRTRDQVQRVDHFISSLNAALSLTAAQAESQKRAFAKVGWRVLDMPVDASRHRRAFGCLLKIGEEVAANGESVRTWQGRATKLLDDADKAILNVIRKTHNTTAGR